MFCFLYIFSESLSKHLFVFIHFNNFTNSIIVPKSIQELLGLLVDLNYLLCLFVPLNSTVKVI